MSNLLLLNSNILAKNSHIFQEYAAKYIGVMVDMVKSFDSNCAIGIMYNIKQIGEPHPDELAKYKDFFEGKRPILISYDVI